MDDQRVAKGLKGTPNSLAGRYPGGYPRRRAGDHASPAWGAWPRRRGFIRRGTTSPGRSESCDGLCQLRLAVSHPATPGGRALHAGLVWSEFCGELPYCLEPVSDVLPLIATARDVDFKGAAGYLQVGRLSSEEFLPLPFLNVVNCYCRAEVSRPNCSAEAFLIALARSGSRSTRARRIVEPSFTPARVSALRSPATARWRR